MLASLGINSLAIFPEVGLLVFLAIWVGVAIRALRKPGSEIEACARLPLDETCIGADDTKQERSSDR